MSGVRNLRAMFEQKGEETSPPDRGRSPGIPLIIGSESPRPLSKVRTDFIAIEKDGRIGLQRGLSQDSNVSITRKLSGDTDIPTPPAKQENRNIFADAVAKAAPMTSLQNQPIPESPRVPDPGFPVITSPSKTVHEVGGEASTSSPRRFKKHGTDMAAEKPSSSEASSAPKVVTEPANGTSSGKEKEKANGKLETPKPSASTTARVAPKPLSVPSASKTMGKSAKSPTASKAPKSPAEASTPKLPAKTPERFSRQPEKVDTPKTNASTSRTPRAQSVKRPPPLQPSPAGTGFVKPKPKSPTRPVRLPAGLTTHTASSGSKVNPSRQSLSRNSGSFQTAESLGRSPSRGSVSTVATAVAGGKSLKRQSSTINRPRPSLGPPPKQSAKEYPPIKNEKQVDESFLARMMRPTQASASKTNDKATTPPRKPTVAAAVRKPASKADGKAVKRTAPRLATTAAGSSRAPPSAPATRPVVEAEPTIETAETAIAADQAVQGGQTGEGQTPPPSDAGRPTTAQEVALLVENIASAEEAIEAAKEIEGEAALPEPSHDQEHADEAVENVDTLVKQTEALSLEDTPHTPPSVNGHHKDDEANDESASGDEEHGLETALADESK